MKKLFLTVLLSSLSALAAPLPAAPLSLGGANLPEQRRSTELLPGVTLTSIQRGSLTPTGRWTVNVAAFPARADADKLLSDLKAAGFEGRLDPMQVQGSLPGELGFMLRVGAFSNRAQADALLTLLKDKKFSGGVQFTGEDGGPVSGPWAVQVLSIQPDAQARVQVALASDILPGRETTSSLARRLGAVAAVNGGFFVVNNDLGSEGDLAGISVVDGALLSEAIDGRPAFLLDRSKLGGQVLTDLTSTVNVVVNGQTRRASGLNRKPGLVVNCGNFAATPTVKPAHDLTCKSENELIVFRAAFGPQSDAGDGVEVVVDASGNVSAVQDKRGATIPAGGFTVQATGDAATWLKTNARVGQPLRVTQSLQAQGKPVPLSAGLDIVNGGPTLLLGGNIVNQYAAEGWSPEGFSPEGAASAASRLNFYNGWVLRRNPRTAVGTMPDGTLLLVTVDGRNPTHSIGASIPEMAQLMRDLGAKEALNLDGGGSTATYVNGMLQGVPSDTAGERPDGDAILIFPK